MRLNVEVLLLLAAIAFSGCQSRQVQFVNVSASAYSDRKADLIQVLPLIIDHPESRGYRVFDQLPVPTEELLENLEPPERESFAPAGATIVKSNGSFIDKASGKHVSQFSVYVDALNRDSMTLRTSTFGGSGGHEHIFQVKRTGGKWHITDVTLGSIYCWGQ